MSVMGLPGGGVGRIEDLDHFEGRQGVCGHAARVRRVRQHGARGCNRVRGNPKP
jgi:hypothetical protein